MQLFTADWHLGHKNIMQYCGRPFDNVDTMADTFFENLWSMWTKGDTLYFLGDMSLKKNIIVQMILRLQARRVSDIVFLYGNHDAKNVASGFGNVVWAGDIKTIKLQSKNTNAIQCMLCHYPMRSWKASYHDSLHLHGHSHGATAEYANSLDVGIDNAFKLLGTYRPFTADEVHEQIQRINKQFPRMHTRRTS